MVIAGAFADDRALLQGRIDSCSAAGGGKVVVEAGEYRLAGALEMKSGVELHLKVFIVKAGRSLIRQRAELTDAATGKLLATASGSWMPL